jgi:DNA-binding XRE family transcriptional regulator
LALSPHQIEGEWFRVTRSAAVEAVEECAARVVSPAEIASAAVPAGRIRKAQEEDMALIRAGRRMLGWTQTDLAARAGISVATLKNIERGTSDPQICTLKVIQAALGSAGIVFLQPGDMRTGGKGVRLKG